ncbi:MAG TPA: ABC transporter substrate-binding protein, partial [Caproiciproducens sp.]|nr:ABC transporter substrate-binding protein [Caproiciproducens sp.]
MKNLNRMIPITAFLLALAVLLSACGTKDGVSPPPASQGAAQSAAAQSTDQTKYKYGKIDIPGKDGSLCGAPIYIAYEKGFFAE